eukprot:CAMPEP_0114493100 /NCGR_PEP_ID=MMETSP0109-20121206/3925_1 /TAXON_ID=29199 /ORGANISM="Chlorarachnion reptans, Strain CCCM449" /LENGTH=366 /DNA_ID=CAMNT_0001670021 /DNA_START=20 /DNA_END=1120 /DNA_ORIENTATION=+
MDVYAVQGTSDDAAVSKLCAAERGYIDDEFLQHFVIKKAKRSPLINRGYYARVAAFEIAVKDFLTNKQKPKVLPVPEGKDGTSKSEEPSSSKPESVKDGFHGEPDCQIVCLGAGFDTTYFKMKKAGFTNFRYIEVDMADIVKRKSKIIRATPKLMDYIFPDSKNTQSQEVEEGEEVHSSSYHLVPCDLRDTNALDVAMTKCKADFSKPTLFISECVLVYMEAKFSTPVIKWACDKCKKGGGYGRFLCYEQIRPDDPFGVTMVKHLKGRGCALLGLESYPTLESQIKRYFDSGWTFAEAHDMNTVYAKILDRKDVSRIERLELFDEFEEWKLFGGHYAFMVGSYVPSHSKETGDATGNDEDTLETSH